MHIAVNARRLEGQPFGVARYIQYILKCWSRLLEPGDRVTLFARAPIAVEGLQLSDQFQVCVASPRLTGATWENLVLSRHAASADVLFCPSYTAPLMPLRIPLVVATHSLDEAQRGTHSWFHDQTYARWYRLSATRAQRVVVPSQWTADAMKARYGIPAERIEVVHLGVDTDIFKPITDERILRDTRLKYLGADVPYILFVGKMSRRRNIPALLSAFAQLKARTRLPHKLLLFGPNHEGLPLPELLRNLGIESDVVQTDGRIASHSDLVPVYAAADVFVHPTSFDATSLPVHEAFAAGVPVLTVRTSGIAEIAAGTAWFAEESTGDALADGLERVLTDAEVRSQLRAQGLRRAAQRTWHETARLTLNAIRETWLGARATAA